MVLQKSVAVFNSSIKLISLIIRMMFNWCLSNYRKITHAFAQDRNKPEFADFIAPLPESPQYSVAAPVI
jgi:hypothetical protein